MSDLTTQYDKLIEKYTKDGKVNIIVDKDYDDIMDKIRQDLEDFRLKEQERRMKSAEAIASVVLTA